MKIKIKHVKCLAQLLAYSGHSKVSSLLLPSGSSMANPDNLHFLSYCRVFLKEQIDVYVKAASSNAPSHSSYYLQDTKKIPVFSFQFGERGRNGRQKKIHVFTESMTIQKYISLEREYMCPSDSINYNLSKIAPLNKTFCSNGNVLCPYVPVQQLLATYGY